jgi:hypothetical protein
MGYRTVCRRRRQEIKMCLHLLRKLEKYDPFDVCVRRIRAVKGHRLEIRRKANSSAQYVTCWYSTGKFEQRKLILKKIQSVLRQHSFPHAIDSLCHQVLQWNKGNETIIYVSIFEREPTRPLSPNKFVLLRWIRQKYLVISIRAQGK